MSFSFPALSDDEINNLQNRDLLPDGIYPFIVRDIKQRNSEKGNPMLEIKLAIFDTDGKERIISDYLVATETMMFKIKHFCEAIGFENEYKTGSFDPRSCVNRGGKAKIGTKKGDAKPDGSGYYASRNKIVDYLKSTSPKEVFNDPLNF